MFMPFRGFNHSAAKLFTYPLNRGSVSVEDNLAIVDLINKFVAQNR